jgi:predicted RNase H-like HicB family nuclease
MSLPYTIHIERFEEMGYVSYKASVLEFKNCDVIQLTEEQARSTIREIMRIWIEARLHHKDMPIPKPYGY